MAEYNKQKYYWIKITDKFLTSDTVDFLMEQKDGANYVVLYQLLCLKTINQNGELYRNIGEIIIPYDEEKIQRDMKWFSIDTVRVAMSLYKRLGLIYQQENGVLRIANFERMVGSQTISAAKKQEQIARRIEGGKKVEKIPPDIDIEKDIDIEEKENIIKEKESHTKEKTEIIDYLNSKLGTKYRVNSKLTSSHINARLEEGYSVDDFKRVIDSKILKWGNDIKMSQYLTPDTLFGVKFEKDVNETPTEKTTEVIEHDHNDCPYCHGTGVILDRDENGEEVARICKCQMRNGVIRKR